MVRPPSGTVTFLFSDLEDSTALWDRHSSSMALALPQHDRILRQTIESHDGFVFKTVGDAFCAAFSRTADALATAIAIQQRLQAEAWPADIGQLRTRIGIHAGTAVERDDDYFGPALNRVARIESAAHGGQILLSHVAQQLMVEDLPADVTLIELGEFRLKGLSSPERLFQVAAPGLAHEFPPPHAISALLTNLPALEAELYGRDDEKARLSELFIGTRARLVTLTGPGGVGKTTLAQHTAGALLDRFPDGVYQVSLASLSEAAAVPAVVAATLGIHELPDIALVETLRDYLRPKHMLLLVDNCEHLLAATTLLSEWLAVAPGLAILATSRSPLGLRGEREFPVAPLPLPDTKADHVTLAQAAAVALFMDRAQAVHPDLVLTDANAPIVSAICQRLEGLPLAIELAAARTRLLPLADMLQLLDTALPVLTGGPRDAPSRQRSMRETIAWSYRLLSPAEQKLFRLLGIFRGGFSLEGLVALADFDSPLSALEHLEPLAAQSLILSGEIGGKPRFWLLETVREYALEELTAAGELDAAAERHLNVLLEWARVQASVWRAGDYQRWFATLDAERDNLRAALQWALDEGRPPAVAEQGAWLAGYQWSFWLYGNTLDEARRSLQRALDRVSWAGPARAKALVSAGIFDWQVGAYETAETFLREGLAIWRAMGGPEEIADATHMLGHLEFDRRRPDAARKLFTESLERYTELGEATEIATLTADLGLVAMHEGQYEQAETYYLRAMQHYRQTGAPEALSDALYRLGDLHRIRGDFARAATLFAEALDRVRPSNYKLGIASGLHKLAQIARVQHVPVDARRNLHEALRLQREVGNKQGIVECLAAIGGLALDTGQIENAARLLAAAEALLAVLGAPLSPPDRMQLEQDRAAVHETLGDERFQALWSAGQDLSWDQAADEALTV